MKATHTGKLLTLDQLVQDHDGSIGIGHVKCLMSYGGVVLKLTEERNGFSFYVGETEYRLKKDLFTDLKDINPKIEIPETPFYFKTGIGVIYEVSELCDSEKSLIKNTEDGSNAKWHKEEVYSLIDTGNWTLCDPPEKKMRPFTDEEFYSYFKDGNPWMDEDTLLFPARVWNVGVSFYRCNKMEVISFSRMIHKKDKNGNKFEKEITGDK